MCLSVHSLCVWTSLNITTKLGIRVPRVGAVVSVDVWMLATILIQYGGLQHDFDVTSPDFLHDGTGPNSEITLSI